MSVEPGRFGIVECVICGQEGAKNAPRQTTCGNPVCRDANRRAATAASYERKKRERRDGPRAQLPPRARPRARMETPFAGALADVVLYINEGDRKPSTDLKSLDRHVRWLVDAVRTKDRKAYEAAAVRLAAFGLLALARVRASDDASPS